MADDAEKQLTAKIKKAVLDERIKQRAKEQVKSERPKPQLLIRKASEIKDEALVTLFSGRLVRGAFQLVVGPGEAGKGMQSVDMLARLSTGEPFPDEGSKFREPMTVMVCITEDAAPRVKARLRAARADLDRVLFVDGPPMTRGGLIVPSPIAFDDDAGVLVEQAKDLGVSALFLETTVEHLGDRNGSQPSTNNEAEVRRSLAPIIAACREANLIGWGVMHPRKSVDGGIEDSISGSAGFRNVARSTLHVYPDPTDESEDRWRLLFSAKANYLKRRPPTLRFRVESWEEDESEGRVVWGVGKSLIDPRSAQDIWAEMQEARTKARRRDHSVIDAEAFLNDLLSGGKRLKATEVRAAAKEAGIDWRSIERAKAKMRTLHSVRDGFQGAFVWEIGATSEDDR